MILTDLTATLLLVATLLASNGAQADQHSITLTAAGDIMTGSIYPTPLLPARCSELFAGMRASLGRADVTFGNLEGAITTNLSDSKPCNSNCFFFAMPPETPQCLLEAGFNVVSVANNHAGDFGVAGRRDTARYLREAKLAYSGQDDCQPAILERKGLRIGVLAFSPSPGTCPMNDHARAGELIHALAAQTDITVVSMHAGAEGMSAMKLPEGREFFFGQDRGDVRAFAKLAVDAGADLVLGHGPHVPRALQLYKGRLIAYSLGNFATWQRFNLKEANGVSPLLNVELDRQGRLLSGQIISAFQTKQSGPQPDPEQQAAKLVQQLTQRDVPGHGLQFGNNGHFAPALQ
ncbi:CapA family protein [Chitinilyticum piscinae]|uniref:CapA family protein n=1 Tax=Chitinilyticum piscinae TaxID=2866724 RepID=A0A8J7K2C5_9NEIS|nr:CapA family protein [Chitinilyticum piscinae]MBE9609847.1 CapA family protein [Chitinilyticum piscinae]